MILFLIFRYNYNDYTNMILMKWEIRVEFKYIINKMCQHRSSCILSFLVYRNVVTEILCIIYYLVWLKNERRHPIWVPINLYYRSSSSYYAFWPLDIHSLLNWPSPKTSVLIKYKWKYSNKNLSMFVNNVINRYNARIVVIRLCGIYYAYDKNLIIL